MFPCHFPLVFGLLFVFAFLTWSAAGAGRMPLTALLAGALALSVPLIFGAMCGLVGERSGIINIAIEGQLLFGAFAAAVVASSVGSGYVQVKARVASYEVTQDDRSSVGRAERT